MSRKGFFITFIENGRFITVFKLFFIELDIPPNVWQERSEIGRNGQLGYLVLKPWRQFSDSRARLIIITEVNFEWEMQPMEPNPVQHGHY